MFQVGRPLTWFRQSIRGRLESNEGPATSSPVAIREPRAPRPQPGAFVVKCWFCIVRLFVLALVFCALVGQAWATDPAASSTPMAAATEAADPGDSASPEKAPKSKAQSDLSLKVRRVVALLDHPRYAVRHQASQQLAQLPLAALEPLLHAFRTSDSAEARSRIREGITHLVIEKVSMSADAGVGFLGVSLYETYTTWDEAGRPVRQRTIVVASVLPEGRASQAGLEPGDEFLRIGGHSIDEFDTLDDFVRYIASCRPGTKLPMLLVRGGQTHAARATVGNRLNEAPPEERKGHRVAIVQNFWLAQEMLAQARLRR